MTKPVANIPLQIKRLEAAREAAKALPRGTTLSAVPMAELIGMTWVALKGWCRSIDGMAESGVYDGGGNGVNYVFRPLKTIDFLLRHFRAAQKVASRRQNRVREIIGGTALAQVPEDYSIDELKKMIDLSIKLQEQQVRQGKLVDADKVRGALTTMTSTIQQAALRAAMEQDVTGQWPAEIREAFETSMRNVLGVIEKASRDCIQAMAPGK